MCTEWVDEDVFGILVMTGVYLMRNDITHDARLVCRLMSRHQYLSKDCTLPKYMKLTD